MRYLSAFLTMLVVDYAWAIYIKSSADNKPFCASLSGAFIFVAGSFITIQYVEDKYVLIPATLGGMLGTYLSLRNRK